MPTGLGDEKLWLCPSLNNSPNDISGNGNNGVYQNGMGTVADVAEGGSLAYDLAVNEDHIEISGIGSNWRASGKWTLSMWIKGMASQGNQALVPNGNVNIYRGSTSGETAQAQQLNPGIGTGYVSTGVSTNVWYHLTCTSDGTDLKMFANGVEFSSVACGLATANTGSMLIGSTASQSPNGSPIVRLDDIRAYDRPLTQSEITHLATSRGIEGPAPVGLGDEKLWLCPSINNSPNDISGNGNNGVYQGNMGTVTDVSNGGSFAYYYDGVNDYIDCGTSASLDKTSDDPVSQSGWVKVVDTATTQFILLPKSLNGGSYRGTHLTIKNGLLSLRIINTLSGNELQIETAATLTTGWHHIAFSYDGSRTSAGVGIYLDGVSQSLTAITSNLTAGVSVTNVGGSLLVSTRSSLDFKPVNGTLQDDLRLFDRAITQAEITHLASQRGVLGTPFEGLGDEQLWLCPSLQDGTSDLSGNNNDGVYQNGMTTIPDTSNGGSLAYDFDGTADYIDVASSGVPASAYTVSLWQYSTSNNVSTLFNAGDLSNNRTINMDGVRTGNFDDAYGHQSSGNFYLARNPTNRSSATWYHYLLTYDGSELRLYVDGSFVANLTGVPPTTYTEAKCYIGKYIGGGYQFAGRADDIRTYGRTLTQAEITHLATSRGIEGSPSTPTTQYNAFATHAFTQLFQQRLR